MANNSFDNKSILLSGRDLKRHVVATFLNNSVVTMSKVSYCRSVDTAFHFGVNATSVIYVIGT